MKYSPPPQKLGMFFLKVLFAALGKINLFVFDPIFIFSSRSSKIIFFFLPVYCMQIRSSRRRLKFKRKSRKRTKYSVYRYHDRSRGGPWESERGRTGPGYGGPNNRKLSKILKIFKLLVSMKMVENYF